MYQNSYSKASDLAEKIRNGQYDIEKKQKEASLNQGKGLLKKPKPLEEPKVEPYDPLLEMAKTMALMRDSAAPETSVRPRTWAEGGEDMTIPQQASGLMADEEFTKALKELQQKHGVSQSEVFSVIKGESGFNPTAFNKGTKAAGLFQFIPSVLGELGFTTEEVLEMEPAEQVRVYSQYLDRWDYQGEGLGILQAAPAYRKADDNDIIYDVGTAAWDANPGWRTADNGPITKASINRYYRRTR